MSKACVLVTCLDWRKKYIQAVGDPSFFDLAIDITSLVHPRTDYDTFPIFHDTIREGCTRPTCFEEFRQLLVDLSPTLSIVLRPRFDSPYINRYLNEVAVHSKQWGMCLNRHTIKSVTVKAMVLEAKTIIKSCLDRRKQLPQPDIIWTNSVERQLAIIARYRPRKVIKVCHMDHLRPEQASCKTENKKGLFLDSYIPFHVEFKNRYDGLSPQNFYTQLKKYLNLLKNKFGLDEIVISAHPNSDGAEKSYLQEFEVLYEGTAKIIHDYNYVWSFASDANAFAVQLRIPCSSVVFTNMLPSQYINKLCSKSRGIGVPVYDYDGCTESSITKDSSLMALKRRILRYYLNPKGPTLVESLQQNLPSCRG